MAVRPATDPQQVLESWVCLHRGHATVKRSVATQLHEQHRLTVNDYEALTLLARADSGQMRRVDLARELQLTASGVTRLLDGLEEQGLVKKKACATDARVCYSALTERGRRRLEQASAAHIATIRALFEECYSSRELALLSELLGRLPRAGAAL